jgi:hypothetical protein
MCSIPGRIGMLTTDAIRDRQWTWVPALRKVLERYPDRGLTSIDEGEGEYVRRVLLVARLALAHPEELRKASVVENASALHEDLDRVATDLEKFASHLGEISSAVQSLHDLVEQGVREDPQRSRDHRSGPSDVGAR